MKRARIEEIREWAQAPDKYLRKRPGFRLPDPGEIDELCSLALRATDPELVLVPRENIERLENMLDDMINRATKGYLQPARNLVRSMLREE